MKTAIIKEGTAKVVMNGTVVFRDENDKQCGEFDLASMGEFDCPIEYQSMMVDDHTQVGIKFSVFIPQTVLIVKRNLIDKSGDDYQSQSIASE